MKPYLCLGGPLNNRYLTSEEVSLLGYCTEYINYNGSGCSRPKSSVFKTAKSGRKIYQSMVRIHKTLLEVDYR